jgi:uncharacterized protein (TIGR03083 family)
VARLFAVIASARLEALRTSVNRLRAIVEPLGDDTITQPAYPTEWTIAQVLSHIGSGAVILGRRVEDGIAGNATPDDFAPSVWDVWNAKTPRAQADDALAADTALLARVESVTGDEAERFTFALGPMTFDFEGFLGLRLNEHVFHTWDVEVALDPTATIPSALAALVIDNLELVARFTAKPAGDPCTVAVRTSDPERNFVVEITAESAALASSPTAAASDDVGLPAEAFARLVYGRLDPDHTPPFSGDAAVLDHLRSTFPGM